MKIEIPLRQFENTHIAHSNNIPSNPPIVHPNNDLPIQLSQVQRNGMEESIINKKKPKDYKAIYCNKEVMSNKWKTKHNENEVKKKPGKKSVNL